MRSNGRRRNIAAPVPPGETSRIALQRRAGVRTTAHNSLPIRRMCPRDHGEGAGPGSGIVNGRNAGNAIRRATQNPTDRSGIRAASHIIAAPPRAPPPRNPVCHQADAFACATRGEKGHHQSAARSVISRGLTEDEVLDRYMSDPTNRSWRRFNIKQASPRLRNA